LRYATDAQRRACNLHFHTQAVEENVAQTVCLLLLDLYIAKRLPEKAGFVLQ
jgi:hypothetical protein